KAGFKVLIRTGQFLPRLGGTLWTLKPYADQHPDTVKAFIRAIAEAITYIRTNKDGTMPVFKTYLNIEDPQEQALLWQELHDLYEATIPLNLFRDTFEARRNEMISLGQWSKDKPLPDLHQFLAGKLLDEALKEVHYVSVETKPAH
ncbi:MAG TPA: hypothetical protein VFN81_00615, partial [Sphingomicrobium sp.]|nr:hypothetical protein [Sphingomicrobium sp.]